MFAGIMITQGEYEELQRLRMENAAMRPIVEMFARGYTEEATIGFPEFIISLDDDAEFVATDAMLAQARAFLASVGQAEKTPQAGGFFDTDGKWHSLFPGEE